MSDIKKTKEEMSEEYKAQLAAREALKAKEQQDKITKQMRQKQAANKAKREMEAKRKELQTELAGKKIAECNAKIAKAEKVLESEKTYDLIAKIALGACAFMLILSFVIFLIGLGVDALLVPMIAAFLIICISIFFQAKPNFAKKEIRDNKKRIKKIRQELYAVKNRH